MTLARRRRRAAAAVGGAALACALAGCGIQSTGIAVVGAAPTPLTGSAAPTALGDGGDNEVTVYFLTGDDGTLVPVQRTVSGPVDESKVISLLIGGPTKAEGESGLYTDFPPGFTATPNAESLQYAYGLNEVLDQFARSQFICTMQAYDLVIAIGYISPNMKEMEWLGCSDTTTQIVLIPGLAGVPSNATTASAMAFATKQ